MARSQARIVSILTRMVPTLQQRLKATELNDLAGVVLEIVQDEIQAAEEARAAASPWRRRVTIT